MKGAALLGNPFRSLRHRLALLYLLVFGVIQVSLCMLILVERERELYRDFHSSIQDRLELVADELDTPPLASIHERLLASPSFVSFFVQIRQPDGTILQRSPELGEHVLPFPTAPDSDAAQFEIIEGTPAAEITEPGGSVCVYGAKHVMADGSILHVSVARSMVAIKKSIADLWRIVFTTLAVGLLICAVASVFVARRSLAPIGIVVRQAREIAGSDLRRRLNVPSGTDEVSDMVRVLNGMLDRLEQVFSAQEHFIADVSHELQTPLTVLLAEAQLMSQRSRSPQEHQDFLASAQDELRRLNRIVNSLLMLARAESDFPMQGAELVSANHVVADAVAQCAALTHSKKIEINPVFADEDEHQVGVIGHGELLTTAVVNLIRNAIRFAPPGTSIDVKVLAAQPHHVEITVRDSGPGIDAEHLPRIFKRFYRATQKEGEREGMGLGLAIAKAIVDIHEGSISAANCKDGGCEFQIRLPIAVA